MITLPATAINWVIPQRCKRLLSYSGTSGRQGILSDKY